MTWKSSFYRLLHLCDKLNSSSSPRTNRIFWSLALFVPLITLPLALLIVFYGFTIPSGGELSPALIFLANILILAPIVIDVGILLLVLARRLYNLYLESSEDAIKKAMDLAGYNNSLSVTRRKREAWTRVPLPVPRKTLLIQAGVSPEYAATSEMNSMTAEEVTVMAGLQKLSR